MNTEILLQLFQSSYNRQSFIDHGLLPTFQGKVSKLKIYDEQTVQAIELNAAERHYAVSVAKYGEFQTTDEVPRTVELFEVIVNDNVQIERSRVGLGALVKKHIIGNNAVLVNFAYNKPAGKSWRFSFIAREGVFLDGEMHLEDTQAKRYTYVFGEADETYKTAINRFSVLSSELTIDIKKIKDAFGVEAMSKAFFDEYLVNYNAFVHYLCQSAFHQSAFNGNDKEVRDFVKKLLGRIVFLYFLQKKGWMGASNTQYRDGDKNFMSNFFRAACDADGAENFYPKWLTRLFFDALNSIHPNDDFLLPNGQTVKIPYLNGGLFEKDSDKYDWIIFPRDLFKNLFVFFDQFNFTIFEDSPEEHTVAVDPEMLGHIFENLLEDNKDKGAFYTPKEIVHYMTQESLTQYLHTQLPDIDKDNLEHFVKNRPHTLNSEQLLLIDQKLDTVKICDPAIGSGAFPMGLLQEIFGLKERIAYERGDTNWDPATVKANIIQQSIYGVDIEQGAVDIARLRFWLSLVVDEELPKPLPNLDYKILVGNSLVSKFGDTVLEIDWNEQKNVGREKLLDMLGEMSDKQRQFFESKDNQQKAKLKADIRNLKLDILTEQLKFNRTLYMEKNPMVNSMMGLKPADHKKNLLIEIQLAEYKQALDRLDELKANPQLPLNHFDWKLDFPEVMNPMVNKVTGFDIVIGNPPYVQLQANGGNLGKQLEKQGYETFAATGDIYCVFYEQGWKLLRPNGCLNFITSNKWMRAGYGEKTRQFFATKTNPLLLVDFAGQKIFATATVDTNILMFQKAANQHATRACVVKKPSIGKLAAYIQGNTSICKFTSHDSWTVLTPIEQGIKEKIERIGTPLKDWDINIYRGILTGLNEAFIIDGVKKQELIDADPKSAEIIHPILRGRDIKRYGYEFADLWLIHVPWHFPLHKDPAITGASKVAELAFERNYPAIYGHLLQHKDQLSNRNKAETGIRYEWYALQRWGANYMDDFFKPKIVWIELTDHPNFALDEKAYFLNNTVFFITGKNLEYILAFLNSKICEWHFDKICATSGVGTRRWIKQYIEQIHIPQISTDESQEVAHLAESMVLGNSYNSSKKSLDYKLEQVIAQLFDLSEIEFELIMSAEL